MYFLVQNLALDRNIWVSPRHVYWCENSFVLGFPEGGRPSGFVGFLLDDPGKIARASALLGKLLELFVRSQVLKIGSHLRLLKWTSDFHNSI